MLLQECEKKELALQAKLEAKLDDRDLVSTQLEGTEDHLDSKNSELEAIGAKRNTVVAEFDELVPGKDIFREQLSKIFFKCVGLGSGLGLWLRFFKCVSCPWSCFSTIYTKPKHCLKFTAARHTNKDNSHQRISWLSLSNGMGGPGPAAHTTCVQKGAATMGCDCTCAADYVAPSALPA